MATILAGTRIGKDSKLSVGVSAIIFNPYHTAILLIKRTDNGRYCFPGGRLEPGESLTEGCVREAEEETGLIVNVTGVTGVGSNPDLVYTYPDGNKWQTIEIDLMCQKVGGVIRRSDESSDFAWISRDTIKDFDVMESELVRLKKYLDGEFYLQ